MKIKKNNKSENKETSTAGLSKGLKIAMVISVVQMVAIVRYISYKKKLMKEGKQE
jgi:hypothetical protein